MTIPAMAPPERRKPREDEEDDVAVGWDCDLVWVDVVTDDDIVWLVLSVLVAGITDDTLVEAVETTLNELIGLDHFC